MSMEGGTCARVPYVHLHTRPLPMSVLPHPLLGRRVRAALHYHVGAAMATRFVEGTVAEVNEDVDVAREGEAPRVLTLVTVVGIEEYREGEATVPLHDVTPLDDSGAPPLSLN